MAVLWADNKINKTEIQTIQINLGNKCNQRCSHCHIGASPNGKKNMEESVARKILSKLLDISAGVIEFTGGAPELNPNLELFLTELGKHGRQTVVRTNLTLLDTPEYSFYMDLYRRNNVKIIASLPSCFKDITDRQRGKGGFDKSIKVLQKLNSIGYGFGDLGLELVYNPEGIYLPPSEKELEKDYRKLLNEMYGITFNRLVTITNSPIGGFRRYLLNQSKFDDYMKMLVNNFNPETLNNIMCRRLLSIDYQGFVYDCDFNLALEIRVKDYEEKKFWEMDFENFNPEITCGEHCYACTVNQGSSCHGALIKDETDFDVTGTVKQYYGSELKSRSDLKTGACCTTETLPSHITEVMPYIADEIKQRYYGCGSPVPLVLNGLRVLDIGCGTGKDCYIFSKLVGEEGFVHGIDMTENQIEVAIRYQNEQTARFGYKKPNVHFIHDYIENLEKHFSENSLDLIVSNCVVNLIEKKEKFMNQISRILKNCGEFYFSDIYADRRAPEHIRKNPVLYSECLGGALYWKDFERIARKAGFIDPRIVSKRVVDISNEEIKKLIGNITFYSITYRLWKIKGLEDACEDYGHVAIYRGGIPESPFKLALDGEHVFEKDKPERVCGNTALMLSETRVSPYIEIIGSFAQHFGLFTYCNTTTSTEQRKDSQDGCSCR
ncbi:MAG: arsenosugar biosynthesis radical SAM protein ArsS [Thermodesulfovibrionales bacterium]|nr:arsenosugar biosynthesis radical SAM protein ArsS [Thermodesulfovibrionales bacterium]